MKFEKKSFRIIATIFCIIIIPIMIIAVCYFNSDKYKLRELYSYIEDDYKPYFEYDKVTIDDSNRLCIFKFKNFLQGDDFAKHTSIVAQKINEFLKSNKYYTISDYRIEIWFNLESCGEYFELRNYDGFNNTSDDFIYLYSHMNSNGLESFAKYFPDIKYLKYRLIEEDFQTIKMFPNLKAVDVGSYSEDRDKLRKDYPYLIIYPEK